jgi:uncharacterized protein
MHGAVKAVVSAQTEPGSILFCRATQQSFFRLMTTAALFKPFDLPALTNHQAWELYDAFLANQHVAFVGETISIDQLWKEFSDFKSASPKVWMDAYLAAFAIEHGYTLVTLDRDFEQFPGLAVEIIS